jgi:Rab proteins geranylgeranyltransferase component A
MKNHDAFLRYSRRFNIDIAPKIMFCKSLSVDSLIRCQASSYLQFNNIEQNFFYNPTGNENLEDEMIKIPFSKSEIFVNKILTLKEKRQLVKTIEMCLLGAD